MINCKTFIDEMNGKPVAVFGLGVSGQASVKALCKSGAEVIAWDDNEAAREKAAKAGARIQELSKDVLSGCGALVMAPGVPHTHAVFAFAKEAGIPVISDIEILYRCTAEGNDGRKIIAVTGTNGKSTTVTLIHHILKSCGVDAALGGNIGTAALDLKLPQKDGVIVLELSSYQLELLERFNADIAVLLNLSPDHIDRHGSMEGYAAAKERILAGAGQAVIGFDDEYNVEIFARCADRGERRCFPVSVKMSLDHGVFVSEGTLYDAIDGSVKLVGGVNSVRTLKGAHNHQNAAAAFAACKLLGMKSDEVFEAMKSFAGLAHRQYPVRVINGVAYINDSKATNADATAMALACMDKIFWIVGGQAKEVGLAGLEPYLDRIKRAYTIGECAAEFGAWLEARGVNVKIVDDMERAVALAHDSAQERRSQPGEGGAGVVLLSPAAASWDQYKNFEARGDHFTKLVEALEG